MGKKNPALIAVCKNLEAYNKRKAAEWDKEHREVIGKDLQSIYCCMALTMKLDYDWSEDDIEEFMTCMQSRWVTSVTENWSMIDKCEEETGMRFDVTRL